LWLDHFLSELIVVVTCTWNRQFGSTRFPWRVWRSFSRRFSYRFEGSLGGFFACARAACTWVRDEIPVLVELALESIGLVEFLELVLDLLICEGNFDFVVLLGFEFLFGWLAIVIIQLLNSLPGHLLFFLFAELLFLQVFGLFLLQFLLLNDDFSGGLLCGQNRFEFVHFYIW
jgi:hypothetical protein